MRTSMPAIVAVLAALALAASPKSSAQAKVDGLVRTGKRQILSGEFALGIASLEEAARAAQEPELLLEIANAYDEWGEHCARSLETFQRFFELCASESSPCAALD